MIKEKKLKKRYPSTSALVEVHRITQNKVEKISKIDDGEKENYKLQRNLKKMKLKTIDSFI